MRYLKEYNIFREKLISEAVIMPWDMDGLVEDLLRRRPRTIQEADDIAEEYGVDMVTYDQFIESIDDEMRAGAPPRDHFMFGPPPPRKGQGGPPQGGPPQGGPPQGGPPTLGGRMPGGQRPPRGMRPPPGMRGGPGGPGGPPPGMQQGGPPPSGLHFAVMNKHTNKMNLVVNYPLFINWLTRMSPPQLHEVIKSILGHENIHWQQFQKMGADPNKYMVDSPSENPKGYLGHFTELMAHAYSIVDEMVRLGNASKEEILDIVNRSTETPEEQGGNHLYNRYVRKFDTGDKELKQLRKYIYQYVEEYFPEETPDDPTARYKAKKD